MQLPPHQASPSSGSSLWLLHLRIYPATKGIASSTSTVIVKFISDDSNGEQHDMETPVSLTIINKEYDLF